MGDARRRLGCLLRAAGWALLVPVLLWGGGFLWFDPILPRGLGPPLGGAWILGWPIAVLRLPERRRRVLLAFAGGTALLVLHFLLLVPEADADWNAQVARAPWAEFEGSRVRIHDLRDFRWRSEEEFDARWTDAEFDLADLEGADFVLVPFSADSLGAHTMMSFRFRGGRTLSVSVEVRKRRGDSFGILPGIFRRFTLHYVLAEERDTLLLRSKVRRDAVYLVPIRAPVGGLRRMLEGILREAGRLRAAPAFYSTLFDNCSTRLAFHAGQVSPGVVPLSWRMVLNAHAGDLMGRLGLLDIDRPFEEVKERYRVDGRAREAEGDPRFAERIRGRP